MNTQAVLQLDNVSKFYGQRQALKSVSLEINAGEFVALLGPNGAGKTTLFQLLAGLFVADEGRILVHGHDIRQQAVKALAQIGVVFQQPTLDMDLSVHENLKLHCCLHGINKKLAAQRIEKELTELDLLSRSDDPVRSLSGGNKRKVELARALLHEPQILFMDEASIGLDPAARHKLIESVSQLCDSRGVAILWATHLVDEVVDASKVIVLHHGEILADASPQDVCALTGCDELAKAFLSLTGEAKKGEAA